MEFRKKEKEPNAMEKRNTSIALFVGVAMIPLLLSFILGFNTRKVKHSNYLVVSQQLETMTAMKDSIADEKEALENTIVELNNFFTTGDSLKKEYKETISSLKDKLKDATEDGDLTDIEDWLYEVGKAKRKFDQSIDEIDLLDKNQNTNLKNIHKYGLRWIDDFSDVTKRELNERKKGAENKINQGQVSDAQVQIDDLEKMLEDKEDIIKELNRDLEDVAEDSSKDKSESDKELKETQENAIKIQTDIVDLVDKIREGIVLKMEGKGFLKSNKDEVDELKEELKLKLDKIESHAKDLD